VEVGHPSVRKTGHSKCPDDMAAVFQAIMAGKVGEALVETLDHFCAAVDDAGRHASVEMDRRDFDIAEAVSSALRDHNEERR
jgi:hypothetical protein